MKRDSPESKPFPWLAEAALLEAPPPVAAGVGDAGTTFANAERFVKRVSSEAAAPPSFDGEAEFADMVPGRGSVPTARSRGLSVSID